MGSQKFLNICKAKVSEYYTPPFSVVSFLLIFSFVSLNLDLPHIYSNFPMPFVFLVPMAEQEKNPAGSRKTAAGGVIWAIQGSRYAMAGIQDGDTGRWYIIRLIKKSYSVFDKTKNPCKHKGFSQLLTGIGPVTSALPMRRSTD